MNKQQTKKEQPAYRLLFLCVFELFSGKEFFELLAEGKLDFVRAIEASVVIGTAHIFGESFHMDGFFAKQTGLSCTHFFLCLGNAENLRAQLIGSLSEVSAESVGVFLCIGVTGVASVTHKDDHIVVFGNLELVTDDTSVLLGEQGIKNDAIVAIHSDGVDGA